MAWYGFAEPGAVAQAEAGRNAAASEAEGVKYPVATTTATEEAATTSGRGAAAV